MYVCLTIMWKYISTSRFCCTAVSHALQVEYFLTTKYLSHCATLVLNQWNNSLFVCMCVCACVRACVRACVYVYIYMYMHRYCIYCETSVCLYTVALGTISAVSHMNVWSVSPSSVCPLNSTCIIGKYKVLVDPGS